MLRSLDTGRLAVTGLVIGVAAAAVFGFTWWWNQRSRAEAATSSQWQYASTEDARTATLVSRNRLTEPKPFKGGPATLSIARGSDGYAVRLDIDGDMACSYAPTASTVQVSFDDNAPRTFACANAPDNSGRLLFDGVHSTAYLADPVAFLAQLRTARHVRIAGEFAGQASRQTMEFDLPPGDPVAEVSPASMPLAPAASRIAPATTLAAAPPKAVPAGLAVAATASVRHPVVRVSAHVPVRRHVAGYYLHPYRPAPKRTTHWAWF